MNGTAAVVGADRSSVGAVYKGLAIANDRLYATDFHNGRVDVFDASFNLVTTRGGFTDPKVAEGLRAVRDPGARRRHLRDLREAGRRREATTSRSPGQAYVDEFTPDGAARRARRQQRQEERAAERAVGPRARAGRLQRLRRRPARRQLRQRPHQRVHQARHARGCTRASCVSPTARRSRSTGCGRSRSATAPRPARPTRSTSSPAPRREQHGLFGSITTG